MRNPLQSFTLAGIKKYGENTLWLVVEKIVRALIMFFVGIYIANYFGSSKFGNFNFALVIISFAGILVDMGLDGVLVRELTKQPEKRGEILGSAFAIKLSGFGIMALGLLVLSFFWNYSDSEKMVAIMTLGYLFQSFFMLESFFKAEVCAKYQAIGQITAMIIFAFTRILVVYLKLGLDFLAWCEVIQSATMATIYLLFYRFGSLPSPKWRITSSMIKELLLYAWPLALATLATLIYMRSDQIFIGEILDDKAVGCYAMAGKFVEASYFFPAIICAGVFPAIINAHRTNFEEYRKRLRLLFAFLVWCGVAAAIFFALTADLLVELLLNASYSSSAGILRILSINSILVFFGVARSYWLLTENLQRYTMIFVLCGMVINLTLNALLIPHFGLNGAAWAAVGTQFSVILLIPGILPATRDNTKMFLRALKFW